MTSWQNDPMYPHHVAAVSLLSFLQNSALAMTRTSTSTNALWIHSVGTWYMVYMQFCTWPAEGPGYDMQPTVRALEVVACRTMTGSRYAGNEERGQISEMQAVIRCII